MRWLELSVEVDGEAVEAVAEVLQRNCHGGVAIEAGDGKQEEWCFRPLETRVVVRGFLPQDERSDIHRQAVEHALWHIGTIWPIGQLRVAELLEEEWASAWKQHYQPIRLGQRLLIKPAWLECEAQPADIVITMDPGMAFGTGLHPTTQMCLRALERLVLPGMKVLDVGTGSGILAIAAARLGAGAVLATDIDSVALATARSNTAINGVADIVTVERGSLPLCGTDRFDLIVANIVAQVIAELADEFTGALVAKGLLIAGGLIADRAALARERLRAAGFRIIEQREGDWITLQCQST